MVGTRFKRLIWGCAIGCVSSLVLIVLVYFGLIFAFWNKNDTLVWHLRIGMSREELLATVQREPDLDIPFCGGRLLYFFDPDWGRPDAEVIGRTFPPNVYESIQIYVEPDDKIAAWVEMGEMTGIESKYWTKSFRNMTEYCSYIESVK